MPPRKKRVLVVLDTNVLLAYYLGRLAGSAAERIIRLWREQRRLQLVVGEELAEEYLEILRRLGVDQGRIARLEERLRSRATVTWVELGKRFTESRDPDDNVVLSTAAVGRAKFVITQDRDLLDIAPEDRRHFRFEIVTPGAFLAQLED